MSERMAAELVCDALTMALWRRKMPKGVIVHSDRGSQYCSVVYQRLLRNNQLLCSMSKKGDCYDNAAMESWNHSLKVEAIHGERFAMREMARAQAFEYIEVSQSEAPALNARVSVSRSVRGTDSRLTECPEKRGKITQDKFDRFGSQISVEEELQWPRHRCNVWLLILLTAM